MQMSQTSDVLHNVAYPAMPASSPEGHETVLARYHFQPDVPHVGFKRPRMPDSDVMERLSRVEA